MMAAKKKRISWKVDASGILILFILIALSIFTYTDTKKLIFDVKAVDNTYSFIQQIQGLSTALRDTEMANNAYVLLGKERYIISYRENVQNVKNILESVKNSLLQNGFKNDPEILEGVINLKIADMDLAASERERSDLNSALQIFLTGNWQKLNDAIQTAMNSITERQKIILDKEIAEETASVNKTLRSITAAIAFGLIFFFAAAMIIRRDMLARLRNETLLEEAKTEALQASEFKSQFLANMSHEIRTPMNGIMGMATVLLETKLDEDQNKYAGIIKRSCEALLRIINDILDFSKVEAGKIIIATEPFALNQLLEEIQALFGNVIKQKKISLEMKKDSRVPAMIVGDGGRLRQILNNLIGNAIKFTAEGTVTVTTEVLGDVTSKCRIRFSVKDSGIGIAEENQKKIFGAFQQADGTTSKIYGGTGLGLNISKKLSEAMGGSIGFTSALGKGSTFFFELPFDVAADVTKATKTVEVIAPPTKPLTALVAEDDLANQEVIYKYLENLNIRAIVFPNGKDTLKSFNENDYDLVFLDFQMPDINGIQVLTEMRKIQKEKKQEETPSFLVTAHITDENQKLLTALNSSVIFKPLQFDVFKKRVLSSIKRNAIAVLIADDSEVNQDLLRMFLSKEGFDMDFAPNGSVALDSFKKKTYDIVLMDVQMPVMNGLEAVLQIRAWEKSSNITVPTPILAFTAGVTEKEIKEALDIGCNGYISKPIQKEKCIAVINEHIARKQAQKNVA